MKISRRNGKRNLSGAQVRKARLAARMTQEELAAKMQLAGLAMNQKAITRLETGQRLVADYELVELAAALNLDVRVLLGLDAQELAKSRN